MAHDIEKDIDLTEEMSKINMSLHENSIELWRTEEVCRLKVKSINEIENSILQVNIENKWLEKQLYDIKSRIEEVRDSIMSYDNIIITLYETLTNLEIQYNKQEFEIKKLRNNYELELFIRKELWEKEEKRINNIPEVKSLKIFEKELENATFEHDELSIVNENLKVKIFKARENNDKELNAMIVHFANVYLEMQYLNEREERSRTLLRKLKTEYNEKLNKKNSLLTCDNKKFKTPFWAHTFYPLDSKMMNIKLDSLQQNLKLNYNPDLVYQQKLNNENSKLNNKTKRSVTFFLPSEDKISDKNIDTNVSKSNVYNITNSLPIKNMNKMSVNTDQLIKNVLLKPPKSNVDTKRPANENDFNLNINKRKVNEVPLDLEFKKPFIPTQKIIKKNTNILSSKTIYPSKNNENIHKENNLIGNENEISSMSLTSYNLYQHSCFDKNNDLEKNTSLELAEHPNSINSTSNNIKMIRNVSQYNASSFDEQNKVLSGLYSNDSDEPQFENSGNNSFCSVDISTSPDNFSQSSLDDAHINFMDSFRRNFMFKPFNKVHIEGNTSINGTSKEFNDNADSSQLIQPKFNSEQFLMKLF